MNRKYLKVIICCCLYIAACTGTANAQGAFLVPLAEKTGALRGTVSLATTIYGIVSGLCAPLLVKALKRYPVKLIMPIAGILSSLVTCSFGYVNDIRVYLALNVLKGVLNAFFHTTIVIILIGNWFDDLKSSITALVLGASGLAGALFSPFFAGIIESRGLTAGFLIQGLVQFILVLPSFLLSLDPGKEGLEPYRSEKRKEREKDGQSVQSYVPFSTKDVLFPCLCAVSVLTAIMLQFSSHLNGYSSSLGLAEAGPLMVSALMIGNIGFKFVAGFICDKFGNRYGVPFICVVGIAGCLLLILGNGSTVLLIGAFLLGVVYSNQITTAALIRDIWGNSQYPEVHGVQAVFFGLIYLGSTIFGYIYDFTGSYRPCLYLGIVMLAGAFGLYLFMIRRSRKLREIDPAVH